METHTSREPARDRFAPCELLLDFNSAADKLLAELNSGQNGHRQIALYKTNHTTIALFAFEAGGRMPQHRARGTVVIHVLSGKLQVSTPDAKHALSGGQALVLTADVPHDVVAEEPSQMLLTVAMITA